MRRRLNRTQAKRRGGKKRDEEIRALSKETRVATSYAILIATSAIRSSIIITIRALNCI